MTWTELTPEQVPLEKSRVFMTCPKWAEGRKKPKSFGLNSAARKILFAGDALDERLGHYDTEKQEHVPRSRPARVSVDVDLEAGLIRVRWNDNGPYHISNYWSMLSSELLRDLLTCRDTVRFPMVDSEPGEWITFDAKGHMKETSGDD